MTIKPPTQLPTIMLITSSRAEFGVLYWLIKALHTSEHFNFELVVTGNHLVPEQGYTLNEIEGEAIEITECVDIMLAGSSRCAKAKSSALGMMSFADVFARREPDLVMVMGDRYELLGIVSAAALMSIPVSHFSGGEITEGVIDDTVRHTLTKMSQLHFVSNESHRNRVIQLGEPPSTVFNVGEPGLENIRRCSTLSQTELAESLGFSLDSPFILFTFHPVPKDGALTGKQQLTEVLSALDALMATYKVIITFPNNDEAGEAFIPLLSAFRQQHSERVCLIASLGFKRYLSALKHCAMVFGNSSSGLIEAPSFGKPTINIGNRQAGRTRGVNVIDVEVDKKAILNAVDKASDAQFLTHLSREMNPYGDGHTVDKVLEVLKKVQWPINCRKKFYDIGA
ncbi:UDP-N-acetylglucosamine 2-epimerase (hydrolyzing) [Pseudoalteromonas phenolica]|uniref:UDP-N-acetylglucosamine 2-epimerase n=1 Tax=Pseudoalteromonas phenolica TaxID=161398 RepID=UPI00110ACC94|nr:UDP-N-acetylglucosamine 2-epimerase [Pseudoalteromonas phenolica]TMN93829.1 UDP-N-acetylglucosamine 2-epimerase (hydrolyzing) [Pseudoalteromonas phenolica]